MKTRNVYLTFLCVLLCLALLTACAAPRLSAAQIAAARADYPLRSTQNIETDDSYDADALKTFQSIKQNNLQNANVRFDVIEFTPDRINHIQNAFDATDLY